MWNSDNPSSRNYRINTRSRVPKSSDLFWTEFQGWYNPTTFLMTKFHRIHSEPKFKDDTILPHSRWPKSQDHFRESAQGWYNPTSFLKAEVSESLLDICPKMIQSLFILKDRGLQITLGQVPRDDTIPLQHHYSPFRGRSFRTTPILSQKVFELYSRQRIPQHNSVESSSEPSSSTYSVCEYWTIIICISSIWILKASSSVSSV